MEKYFKDPGLSQSELKNLAYHPKYFKNRKENKIESQALTLGSIVDCLLTENKNFDKLFIVNEFNKPSGQIGMFVDYVLMGLSFDEAYKKVDFKRKKDTLEKILDVYNTSNIQDYIKFLKVGKVKKVITKEEYNTALNVVNSLLTHKFTKDYFNSDKYDTITQLEIYWEYKKIPCKSKLDIVQIDHKNKIIFPIDVKTTSKSTDEFKDSVIRYRYDLQSAYYTEALHYWKTYIFKKYIDYSIYNFKFVVENTEYPGTPYVYCCTDNDIYCGKYGGTTTTGLKLFGFDSLVDDYIWYVKNNQWDYKRNVFENNGHIDLNLFSDNK